MFNLNRPLITNHFTITDSIRDLKEELPEQTSEFLRRDYLLALEEAAPPGLSFRYLSHKKGRKSDLLFYFQVINLSSREVGQIVHFEPYSKMMSGISMLIQNLLFGVKKDKPHYLVVCGNMCLSGEYGVVAPAEVKDKTAELLMEAVQCVNRELDKKGKVVANIVKDYPSELDPYGNILKSRKFNALVMDPIMKMEIRSHWNRFDDYLADLSAKYRQRFLQARKKIADFEIRSLSETDLIRLKPRLDVLYKAVQDKSPVRLIKTDAAYLISLSRHLGEKITFKGIFKEGELLAFLCGIHAGDHYEAHHIGIDYHYNKSHSLYLNLLYLYIEMAIANRVSLLSFGRTALEMKTTVGAVPHAYNAYIKLSNSLLNSISSHLLPAEASSNWIPRNPFRQ
ncbi:MAG: GNAT family N-acetyltransferase [Bacteroidia bacterium]|nr:GNAT family N-acetyltransferase [Bacteroidia bacterium]